MRIEVVFDTICPWCFIGKRRLERALARRPLVQAELVWRPFMLNPDMPDGGINHLAYLERKLGGAARVSRMHAAIREAGEAEGIAFDFEAITLLPNTLDSHRLVRWAAERDKADRVVDALFRANFEEGRNIGDLDTLAQVAGACGLDDAAAAAFLHSGDGRGAILTENAQTHRLSINGVPSYVFEGGWGVAGAQDPDVLVRMIDMAVGSHAPTPASEQARTLVC